MSNDQNAPVRGRAFTTHDGADNDGVRAEVFVEVGTGPITEIKPHAGGKTAQVVIQPPQLKHPVHGWVPTDAKDIYDEIVRAHEAQEDVSYRVESQRKRTIARDTPMAELRADMGKAKENTSRIIAQINGIFSREAVTNPKEDPKDNSGRHSALDNDPVSEAPAPTEGFQGGKAYNPRSGNKGVNHGGRREPAVYFEFFDDGSTYNYGSLAAKNAFLCEPFVRKQLTVDGKLPDPHAVAFYISKILEVTSQLQQYYIYGNQAPADNMANSFMQTRYIVEGVIADTYPLPNNPNDAKQWYRNVGTEAKVRLLTILAVIQGSEPPVRENAPNAAPRPAVQNATSAPERAQTTSQAQEPAQRSATHQSAPVDRPDALAGIQRGAGNLKRAETPRGRQLEQNNNEQSGEAKFGAEGSYEDNALRSMVADPAQLNTETSGSVAVYPPVSIGDLMYEDRCGDDELAEARQFCVDRGIGRGDDSFDQILRYTFKGGDLNKVSEGDVQGFIRALPLSVWPDFMGFYDELDADQLRDAVRFVKAVSA